MYTNLLDTFMASNDTQIPQMYLQLKDLLLLFQIHPDLRELMETMKRLSILPTDFEGKNKVATWYVHFYLLCLSLFTTSKGTHQFWY